MIKQDCHTINQCCCQKARNEYKTNVPSTNITESSVGENEYIRCGCSRTDSFKPDYQQDKPPCLDRQTLNALTSFRQRACRFINSESEVTTSSSDANCITQTCRNGNCPNEGNALQKAQELINYAPESAFLKKMKEQCQYLQNNQEAQNVFSTCGQENDFVPYVCDKCVAKSKQILKLSEQLNSGRTKYSTNDSKNNNKSYRSDFTDQQSKTSGLDFIEKTCRSAVNEYQRSLANIAMIRDNDDCCQTQSNVTQASNQNKSKEKKEKSNKKSHHLSRSKRPKKRFHRRKRKSNDSGNYEPQENFEPTLKRPHENSCERCWRYASPARSPVNKPDQRFDPNFRRAHSATDFPVSDEYEKGDSDNQDNLNQRPSTRRKETIRPQTPAPAREQYCANTQVKELLQEPLQPYNEPIQSVSDRSRQRVQNVRDSRTSKSPENHGIIYSRQKPRPKTSIPGSRARDRCLSFDFDDLDVTQYKDIAVGSNRQNQNTADWRMKSVKTVLEPDPSSSREHQRNVRGAFERSRSSPKYSSHSRLSRNNDGGDQQTCGSGHVQADPNFTSQSSHREMLLPQSSRRSPRMPASGYSGTDKGNQIPLMKQYGSYCYGKEDLNREPSSQMQHFQALPPGKTKSSVMVQEQSPRFEKQKPQSAGVGMTHCHCWNYQNISSAFGLEINEGKLRPHPFRPCDCRTQQTQTEGIDYPMASCPENNMCCHCRWIGNSSFKLNRPNGFNTRRESQDGCSHYGPPTNPDTRSCDKHFPNNPDPSMCNQRNIPSFRNGNIDSDYPQDQSDRIIPCPYRQYISNKACLRNHNRVGSYETREDENYSPVDHRNFRNGISNDSNYSPKKYCVFYMTKNKEETGNDVEVLIEELTQRCSRGTKGSKTKSLKEKMKRLMECQSDSMALRFQKGVFDTGRHSQSSRVLYF